MRAQELDRAIREVIKRSMVDPEFRAKALADGNAAISAVAGRSAGFNITFIDNCGKSVKTIVLPDPVVEVDNLREEDLEQVAGGSMGQELCGTSCGGVSCLNT